MASDKLSQLRQNNFSQMEDTENNSEQNSAICRI